jgi:two-component system copper resistance phosphate regulon response regulator CusR
MADNAERRRIGAQDAGPWCGSAAMVCVVNSPEDGTGQPGANGDAGLLCIADLVIDVAQRRACRAGRLALTATELRLLTALVQDAGRPLSRTALAAQVWQRPSTDGSNLVDVGIWRLRAKVAGPFALKLIHAVRGVGYLCADQA